MPKPLVVHLHQLPLRLHVPQYVASAYGVPCARSGARMSGRSLWVQQPAISSQTRRHRAMVEVSPSSPTRHT